jgi:hypothetical protein
LLDDLPLPEDVAQPLQELDRPPGSALESPPAVRKMPAQVLLAGRTAPTLHLLGRKLDAALEAGAAPA